MAEFTKEKRTQTNPIYAFLPQKRGFGEKTNPILAQKSTLKGIFMCFMWPFS